MKNLQSIFFASRRLASANRVQISSAPTPLTKCQQRCLSTTKVLSNDGGSKSGSSPAAGGHVQSGIPRKHELELGEMEGITFKVEPLRRVGEDVATMRARLLYQSRKRGTLESDLLLSTFAATNLAKMSKAQLEEFDRFLDENDWDIYYWATQEPPALGTESETSATTGATPKDTVTETWKNGAAKSGEWAQTVGAFKPAYRPVPERWAQSDILRLLREHVKDKSALGSRGGDTTKATGGGLGRMPDIEVFRS